MSLPLVRRYAAAGTLPVQRLLYRADLATIALISATRPQGGPGSAPVARTPWRSLAAKQRVRHHDRRPLVAYAAHIGQTCHLSGRISIMGISNGELGTGLLDRRVERAAVDRLLDRAV